LRGYRDLGAGGRHSHDQERDRDTAKLKHAKPIAVAEMVGKLETHGEGSRFRRDIV
jgi:hypothetical protein